MNKVGTVTRFAAFIIWVAAAYVGLKVGKLPTELPGGSFNFTTALICWGTGFVAGTLMLALSEIVELLDSIKRGDQY